MSTRHRLARLGAALACVSTSLVLVMAPTTARANSALGLASNAWLISDLGYAAYNAYQSPAAQSASAAELAAASTATRTSTPAPGFTSKPSSSSKLGLVVNGIAVLGTAAFMFNPFDDDAPDLPAPGVGDNTWFRNGTDTNQFLTINSVTSFPRIGYESTQTTVVLNVTADKSFSSKSNSYTVIARDQNCYSVGATVNSSPAFSQAGGANVTLHCALTWGPVIGVRLTTGQGTEQGHDVWATNLDPQPGDPASVPRYIDTTITCKSPAGGSQVLSRTDGPFTFDPAVAGDLIEVPSMECPPGTWLDSGSRDLKTDGTTTKTPMETYNAPSWVETQATRFPDCFPVGNLQCELALRFVSVQVGTKKECSAYPPGAEHPCYQWLRDPDRQERYECHFGPYVIGLRACRALKHAYSPNPTLSPSEPINPGAPDPDDVEVIDPDAPPVDPTPDATPDLNSDGCIPSGWDVINPFAYFKATACALKWAFVPKVGLQTRLDQMIPEISTKIPFSWLSPITAIADPDMSQACPDWRVKVANLDENVICDSSYTQAIRSARPVLLGFMGLLAVWPLIRSTGYAAFPIIKPQPGMLR